jgi:hypothetical protein
MIDAENQMLRGGAPRVSREVIVDAERVVAAIVRELSNPRFTAPLGPEPQPETT